MTDELQEQTKAEVGFVVGHEPDYRELALADAEETGCWCADRRKRCERHDAFEDGVIACIEALKSAQLGWDEDPRTWRGAE